MIENLVNSLVVVASTSGDMGWIDDFGIVLAAAAVAVVVFNFLRLPVLFGYILAGVLVGPHLFSSAIVTDSHSIEQISELGVIFLLFFIGMEFDLRRLKTVLGPALLAIIFQTAMVLYLAQILSSFMSWSSMSTLFFGSLLAISSSMVTVRVLREQNKLNDAHAQYAIGILILEDILAVILLVVLTGVAVTQELNWDKAWLVTFLMGVFVVMVFVIGRAFVPQMVWAFSGEGEGEENSEAITLLSVGLVMGISTLALKLDFSPALGAFVAGALFSQTTIAHKVETCNRSLHDVFAAVFFVSTGMQLNPFLIFENIIWITIIAGLVICVKIFACWFGLVAAGQNSRIAYHAASAKSQIGEFSFIIAALGMSLGVLDEKISGIAYGVALLTIIMTPVMTTRADFLFDRFVKITPQGVISFSNAYRKLIEGIFISLGKVHLFKLIKRPVLQISIYFFVLNGILVLASVLAGEVNAYTVAWPYAQLWILVYWLGVGLILAPFLYAVIRNFNAIAYLLTEVLFIDLPNRPLYQGKLRQLLSMLIFITIFFLFGLLFLSVAAPFLPDRSAGSIAIVFVLCIGFLLRRNMVKLNSKMEILFMDSFCDEVDHVEESRKTDLLGKVQEQTPWPAEIREVIIPEHSANSSSRIKDLDLRRRFGVNILAVGRGREIAFDPGPESPVFSGDRLFLLGSEEQTELARKFIGQRKIDDRDPDQGVFKMDRVFVSPKSGLDGETLAGARIRQNYGMTVVGIQRGDDRIENPGPSELIHTGDILMVAGTVRRIKIFSEFCDPSEDKET